MRTTLNIDDDLYRRTKILAATEGGTVTSVIEEALRELLARRDQPVEWPGLPVSPVLGGFPPGLDMNDNSAVLDFLDEEDIRRGKYR